MALRFYNTRTRAVEEFRPLDPAGRVVKMYCCGPTVHDFAHIGNFRTFVFGDMVRRYLEFKGYQVEQVMNVTDVEDKIIQRVQKSGLSLQEFTGGYEKNFWEDFAALGCLQPHHNPRATGHIAEIIALIEKLFARGLAYRAPDGSVYFSISKYQSSGFKYGQLVSLNFEAMRPGQRVQGDEYAKESVADFALWKARTELDGNVFWPSPWGEGRPGWHIECSAMSMKILGASFDLHLGGEDLIFPHHEDEIAQSEGAGVQAAGCRFVEYWLHAAHLQVDGKKMSKSLGNYFTVRDLLGQGFDGRAIRYLLLSAHYRESFNFTLEGLQGARTALARLDECLGKLSEAAGSEPAPPEAGLIDRFTEAMDDDLNVARAWGLIFDWVREMNRLHAGRLLTSSAAAGALAGWQKVNAVFGVGKAPGGAGALATPEGDSAAAGTGGDSSIIPSAIRTLVEKREEARKARDFQTADLIRNQLKAEGWIIIDTPSGARLKRQ